MNIYFGALDTARTAILNADSTHYISLGEVKLKLAVLLGLTPVFPQTHGWDSAALLQYSGTDYRTGQDESEAFLWLVEEGFMRILLRQRRTPKSLLEAAFAGFEDEKFGHLSAWPEFNLDDPNKADRRAFVAAMRTDKRVMFRAGCGKGVWPCVNSAKPFRRRPNPIRPGNRREETC